MSACLAIEHGPPDPLAGARVLLGAEALARQNEGPGGIEVRVRRGLI